MKDAAIALGLGLLIAGCALALAHMLGCNPPILGSPL